MAEHVGCEHIALLHTDADDLSRRLAPSLRRAADEGGAVLVCVDPVVEARIRADIGSTSDSFTFAGSARYARPGVAMAALHDFVTDATASGVPTVWSIGSVPFAGDHRDAAWIRYEEAVASVFADVPLRAVCLYDAADTPASVREGVGRTHQRSDGEWLSTESALANPAPADPAPSRPPDLLLQDPTPRSARAALRLRFAEELPADQLDGLQLAASELVTNGMVHGVPPVIVRAWREPTGCVLQVHDAGTATIDEFADFRPCAGGLHGGFGLWTIGQLAHSVNIEHAATGNTVTIVLPAE